MGPTMLYKVQNNLIGVLFDCFSFEIHKRKPSAYIFSYFQGT